MAIEVAGMAPLIQVYDMNEALLFYRDALGFELVQSSGEVDAAEGRYAHWCWLRLGGAHLMLNTAFDEGERPPARDAARQAAHGDTGLFFDCPDPDAAAAALRARGIAVDGPRDAPYGMRQLYVADPDGYGLCFQTAVRA
ncbi:MAG TPA: VOC family protein [Allosphingosinicella sp.]|nr:VOC family protein [Allosphingosinicella sp.]